MTGGDGALPAGLRARVLDASRQARPAGGSFPAVPEISPAEAFRRTADALYRTLRGLREDDWSRPAVRDLDVQGLVGHLIGVERDLQRALSGAPPAGRAGHVESTQGTAIRQAGRRPGQTLGEWRRAVARTLIRLAAADDLNAVVAMPGVRMPLRALLVARAFELWAHDGDVRVTSGLPAVVPDAPTLTLMTRLAASLLPRTAGRDGIAQPALLHLVLTGPGGGTWDIETGKGSPPEGGGPARARVSIVADAAAFCRLVANRVSPASVGAHITGDHAAAAGILAAAATLALD